MGRRSRGLIERLTPVFENDPEELERVQEVAQLALALPGDGELLDGRSIYSPDTGGVYWEAQHLPVEEIDRIEVIRGPGGTLWGANAVNGVINIITKSAKETQGAFVEAGAGDALEGFGVVAYP